MDYKRYKASRDLAWWVLLNEGVTELPVKVVSLCKQMGIRVTYYKPVDEGDGYSTIWMGRPRIFVSRGCSPERQRFTVAHELGHILLGHVGEYELVNREPHPGDNPIEQEANVFASRLLAPACVLRELEAWEPEAIAKLCAISYQSASFRAERMAKTRNRGMYLTSPLEREVHNQFDAFIKRQRAVLTDPPEHPASDPESESAQPAADR